MRRYPSSIASPTPIFSAPPPDELPASPRPPSNAHLIAATSAVMVGGFVAVGVTGTTIAYALYTGRQLSDALMIGVAAGLLAGTTVMAMAGVAWVRTTIVRTWHVDDEERRYRFQLIGAPGPAEPEPEAEAEPPAPDSQPSADRIQRAAWEIIALHYIEGLAATRPECEAAGIDQAAWNSVNAALKAAGIKGERTWLAADMHTATLNWRARIRIHPDGAVWVVEGSGQRRVI